MHKGVPIKAHEVRAYRDKHSVSVFDAKDELCRIRFLDQLTDMRHRMGEYETASVETILDDLLDIMIGSVDYPEREK